MIKDFLTTKELAERWGLSTKALEAWRSTNKGPKFSRFGDSLRTPIRYAIKDVLAYEDACVVKNRAPESEAPNE